MTTAAGRHFLQIPGPTNVPDRILRAIERPTIDHRGPEFGRLGERVLSGLREVFRTRDNVLILSVVRDRRLGSGAREHAFARRHGADERDRALLHPVVADGTQARPHRRGPGRRLAHRRRSRAHRGATRGRPRPGHQGGRGGAQRDLHRGDEPHRRGARRARCRRPPGAAAGRHHLLARIHRLPP